MRLRLYRQLSLLIAALCLICTSPARANDWPETAATCARLAALLTSADVAQATGRKGAVVGAATASQSDGCKVEISLPGAKTPSPKVAAIGMTLRQHVSGQKALENVAVGVQLAGGPDKAKDIAADPRGRAVSFKFVFDYVSSNVDAVEVAVLVRDRTLDGRKVAEALGRTMFRKSLASSAIAEVNAEMDDVAGFVAVGPVLAFANRCMAAEMAQHQDARRVFDASVFKDVKLKAVEAMGAYAQRWIALNRTADTVKKLQARIDAATPDMLVADCNKLVVELPLLEAALPVKLLQALKR
jgi:hypothetical protein